MHETAWSVAKPLGVGGNITKLASLQLENYAKFHLNMSS